MPKYARMVGNVAAEVFTPPEGVALAECFHPDVAAQFEEVPEEITQNSTRSAKGKWTIAVPADTE